jgi:murein DD-endopeptidase MepM/ murein hydrolase activator NlpD/peptidoglycan hydrolase-like protein with peptidoglycan-binding domain/3D (Asp-Asp-Asp) domain-containing protein
MSAQDDSARDPVRLPAARWAAESPFVGEAAAEEQAPIHPWYQGYTLFVEGRELEEMYAPEAEWEAPLTASEMENPFGHAFEQGRTSLSEPEELKEEFVEEEERASAGDYAFYRGDLSERGTFADHESWNLAATLEFEAVGCTGDHELPAFESELLDSEIWQGTADQIAFRDRVLDAHIALSRKRAGAAKRDLSPKELDVVAGTNIKMASEAAAAAGRLLAAANADLTKVQAAGHTDALRTIRLSATSGYRGSAHQKDLWLRYFTAKGGYYDQTQTARERLADGPHSEQAITYMLTPKKKGGFGLGGRIAAPGYSNHQGGIAIDFWQERKKGHKIQNNSGDEARAKWRSTWFHKWLRDNANIFGFQPILTEEWHWEYRPVSGTTASASAATSTGPSTVTPTTLPAPSTAQLAAELVRFAQRVLNAAEGERLSDDGDLGRLTRAALERFRKKYGLGTGGVLDASTELALAQRALEELAQASMFAQPGTRDARTEQALITFKSTRQLGVDAILDGPTRRALTDALARRAPKPSSTSTYLGGKLWGFEPKTLPMRVAVFCPQAALSKQEVEILVYAHGLVNGCPRPKIIPDGMITDAPFKLGDVVAASGRPIVLVVPYLDWANPGGESAFGKARRRWHALGKPVNLNSLVAEVLAELGRVQSIATPSLLNLAIAGHSRAYDFLEPLALSYADPQMQQGALARLSQVWAFDTTYAGDVSKWKSWLDTNPGLQVSVFYRKDYRKGRDTGTVGDKFYRQRSSRLKVRVATEGHCAVPAERLPALLNPPVSAADRETEAPWGEDELDLDEANLGAEDYALEAYNDATGAEFYREFYEAFEPAEEHHEVERFDPLDELDADEQHLSAEPELEALAFEAMGSDDEHVSDEDEEFEFEEEDYADQVLEEEASDKSPLPVPVENPVPFAPLPPMGSYWPVRSSRKDARVVSYMYQAPSGIVGGAGRMFLAGRKGKRGGKQVQRWHAGVDLFANIKDVVVACEDGTIVDFSFFYKAKSGQDTYRLLIQHDGSGVVVNYGEVTGDSLRKNGLKVNDRVAAGQPIGFVSDTSMLHFETYIKGTTTSYQWWKDEKTPPRQLLNPTRYLLFLREHGLSSTQAAGTQPAPTRPAPVRPASTPTKPPAELVRFAQRVLNAAEGERLDDDGDLGRLTRGALERFRGKYGLGAGGLLDDKIQLALAQRALEEIAQQSIFAQPGVLDAKTEQALITFKSDRGLGFSPTLDAATRAALADALARRVSVPSGPRPVVAPSGLPKLGVGLTPPTDPTAYRKFRLTTYHVVDQRELPTGAVRVPIYDDNRRKIAEGSPAFFAQLSLEGTARLSDGRLVNVTGKTVPASHDEYAEVLAYHRQAYAKSDKKRREEGKKPTPTAYSGIVVENDRVVRVFAFHEVLASRRGIGYGLLRGIPLVPFRTLAADIGVKEKHDKNWKDKSGLVPPGTHVYIKEYDGLRLPGGITHDGWFIVNDTGGAIFGAHFDVFVGTPALRKQVKLPEFGQVWFARIEQRISPDYTYGLKA